MAVNKHKAALEAARKEKTRKIVITVAVILVAALIITPLAMFANDSFYRIATAATVGNQKFTVADYNYYFNTALTNTYSNMQSQYGDMASYILDTSKPLDEQNYSEDMTWADYFRSMALSSMRTAAMLSAEAEKSGFTFSEEQQAELDQMIESVSLTASLYGYSTDGYLAAAYGSGMNMKNFEKCLKMSYTAECYSESVAEAMTYTQDELTARYEENPNSYDTVDFHIFLVRAAESDDNEAAMTAAKADAEEMAANVYDTASFAEYVRNLCAEDEQDTYAEDESTLQRYISYSTVSAYEYGDWLFDTVRQPGDAMVAETASGYQVVMYMNREDTHYNLVNIRHILIQPEQDEESGEITEEAWTDAQAKAEEVYNTWKSGEATEDSFAALVSENSSDGGSSSNGGLYEKVYKGQMVTAFNDWCFDASRQPGDTDIVKSSYGYHIMYFVGQTEEYWTAKLTAELQNEEYTAWETEKLESYPIVLKESALRYGRKS